MLSLKPSETLWPAAPAGGWVRLTLPGIPIRRRVSPVFDHGKGFAALSFSRCTHAGNTKCASWRKHHRPYLSPKYSNLGTCASHRNAEQSSCCFCQKTRGDQRPGVKQMEGNGSTSFGQSNCTTPHKCL